MLAAQLGSLRIDTHAAAPRPSPLRWVLPALLGVALLGGFLAWRRSRPPQVETASVIRMAGAGGATALLTGGGYVVTKDQVIVSAEVSGRVVALNFDRGDRVAKGQWLARLDDRDYQVALARARAARQRAEADLSLAKAQLARAESLQSQKIGSQERLDDARRGVQVGEAGLAAARAEESQAVLNLERTIIRAPFDGTVMERLIQIGETARPGFGGGDNKVGVAKLADLSWLEVEVDITERDIAKVKEGQRCLIVADAYPDRKYAGFVRLRAPEANRAKSVVQVKVKVDQPDEFLRPEMNAQVTFFDGTPDAAAPTLILVPKAAALDGAVFVLRDRTETGATLARVPFQSGGESGGNWIVTGGLSGGEEVALDPAKLRDGQKIALAEPAE